MLSKEQIQSEFKQMTLLENGWDGYDADPHSPKAIEIAKYLCENMGVDRVKPSVVGGVGITTYLNERYYLEVLNDGRVYLLIGCMCESSCECEPSVKKIDASRLPDILKHISLIVLLQMYIIMICPHMRLL